MEWSACVFWGGRGEDGGCCRGGVEGKDNGGRKGKRGGGNGRKTGESGARALWNLVCELGVSGGISLLALGLCRTLLLAAHQCRSQNEKQRL